MELLALVIDADAHERGVVRNVLQSHNWRVREAASTDAALCLISQGPQWHLVFCDAELSSSSVDSPRGSTLLSELKRHCGETALVVITAATGRPITALDAILNGASEYLRKPLQEEKVAACEQAVIRRLLALERENQTSRRSVVSELVTGAPELGIV